MMNYVAMQLVDYYYNIWKGSKASLGMLNPGTKAGYLPEYNGSSNNIIVTVVLIITVLMYIYLKKTKHGYEIAVVGESENTARYAGIDVKKVIIRTMLISGAVCGICGFLTVSGQDHSIASDSTAGGYGFTAIIVAWLAKFNTAIMIAIALLIVFLEKGTAHIADTFVGFDANASKIVIGIVLFFIIGSEFFINYKLNFPKKKVRRRNQMANLISWINIAVVFGSIVLFGAVGETLTEKQEILIWEHRVLCVWEELSALLELIFMKHQLEIQMRLCAY